MSQTALTVGLSVVVGAVVLVAVFSISDRLVQRIPARFIADRRGEVGPFDIMDRALTGIEERGFQSWVRDAGIGTIIGSVVYAFSDAVLSIGAVFMAPFRAVASGLSQAIEGTFGSAVDVVDAGGDAAAQSFLSGVAGLLGPAAFPVAVASVVAGVLVLIWGFRRFSPVDWLRGLGRN